MASESPPSDRDYVLGTHDAEVERLAFQHAMWREEVFRAWDTAGIRPGSRVADIGCGPGFASLDLSNRVGPGGSVLSVERSARFLGLLREAASRSQAANITTSELDLMHGEIPATGLDAAWCRWVACFVADPALLVRRIVDCLRPGGCAVFHEYSAYRTYSLLPSSPEVDSFVDAVFANWRADVGEPDIARALPRLLVDAGCTLRSVRPIARCARPSEALWNWPAGFIRTNVPRMIELGHRTAEWGEGVLRAVDRAERDEASVFITPTVLEIVAERR